MTSQPRSQCSTCIHYRSPFATADFDGGPTCAAFPGGIPGAVYRNAEDHRDPVDGDHGIRWTSDGRPHPATA